MHVLERLRSEGDRSDETEGVLARCYKDLAEQEHTLPARRELYLKAYEIYRSSYIRGQRTSYYTGQSLARSCSHHLPALPCPT